MKLKIKDEKRYNKISGRISHLEKLFKKVDEGLSTGQCEKIVIYKDKVDIYVTEKEQVDKND